MARTSNASDDESRTTRTTDVLVVGTGIAGCAAALGAAREGAEVLVVTKAERPEDAASDWAQGGISTTGTDPATFRRDILDASAGTADEAAVDVLVENADDAVSDVLVDTLGVEFDVDPETDAFDFTREAAHSEERILHVDASTGRHILRPFLRHLDEHPSVEVLEDTAALELVTHEGRVHGAMLDRDPADASSGAGVPPRAETGAPVFAGTTVLATGGIGDCYGRSTNPAGSTGDGIGMAALAGADVADMEFVQFHPTAFAGSETRRDSDRSGETAGDDDSFLLSEAIRGEGGLLYNADGKRFMPDYHEDAELAPRDVVARAVQDEIDATGGVTLDVTTLDDPFDDAFPDLAAKCEERDVDWATGIPVAPCEHFLCGGIDVDHEGRTSLDRLYAVGECARTGVHGANRLASTSLLEGLVWGLRAGADAAGVDPEPVETPDLLARDPDLPPRFAAEKFRRLQRVMDEYVGLRRSPSDLGRAQAVLRRLKGEVDAYVRTRTARDLYELRHASVTALLVARAAAENDESVGCHYVEAAETAPADD
ncbi:L-aspartate oxidase [Haloarchaeobius sp. HRN-SO-5]|uniref:L-aspartate oxidase n=1 Tax=Haloarchaeobius sp. HRN-SO-5 TaxID=3446118 RepID=UPI003EBA16F3